jgi:hypothetical protein
MNRIKTVRIFGLFLAIALAVSLLAGAHTLAQQSVPATEPGGEAASYMPPSYDSGDPRFQAEGRVPPDDNPPVSANSTAATFSYYQVTGATLRGRNSAAGYVYDGVGCSHVTTAGDRLLNNDLPLPDGSVIKYLRVYYNDTNAANGVEGYITRYQPGTATSDLIHTGSSDAFAGGYGFVVSAEITETVNNTAYAYTLIGWPDAAGTANQICGLRVAYYAPFSTAVFLPVVRH